MPPKKANPLIEECKNIVVKIDALPNSEQWVEIKQAFIRVISTEKPRMLILEKLLSNAVSLLVRTPQRHDFNDNISTLLFHLRKLILSSIGQPYADEKAFTFANVSDYMVFPDISKRMTKIASKDVMSLIVATQLNIAMHSWQLGYILTEVFFQSLCAKGSIIYWCKKLEENSPEVSKYHLKCIYQLLWKYPNYCALSSDGFIGFCNSLVNIYPSVQSPSINIFFSHLSRYIWGYIDKNNIKKPLEELALVFENAFSLFEDSQTIFNADYDLDNFTDWKIHGFLELYVHICNKGNLKRDLEKQVMAYSNAMNATLLRQNPNPEDHILCILSDMFLRIELYRNKGSNVNNITDLFQTLSKSFKKLISIFEIMAQRPNSKNTDIVDKWPKFVNQFEKYLAFLRDKQTKPQATNDNIVEGISKLSISENSKVSNVSTFNVILDIIKLSSLLVKVSNESSTEFINKILGSCISLVKSQAASLTLYKNSSLDQLVSELIQFSVFSHKMAATCSQSAYSVDISKLIYVLAIRDSKREHDNLVEILIKYIRLYYYQVEDDEQFSVIDTLKESPIYNDTYFPKILELVGHVLFRKKDYKDSRQFLIFALSFIPSTDCVQDNEPLWNAEKFRNSHTWVIIESFLKVQVHDSISNQNSGISEMICRDWYIKRVSLECRKKQMEIETVILRTKYDYNAMTSTIYKTELAHLGKLYEASCFDYIRVKLETILHEFAVHHQKYKDSAIDLQSTCNECLRRISSTSSSLEKTFYTHLCELWKDFLCYFNNPEKVWNLDQSIGYLKCVFKNEPAAVSSSLSFYNSMLLHLLERHLECLGNILGLEKEIGKLVVIRRFLVFVKLRRIEYLKLTKDNGDKKLDEIYKSAILVQLSIYSDLWEIGLQAEAKKAHFECSGLFKNISDINGLDNWNVLFTWMDKTLPDLFSKYDRDVDTVSKIIESVDYSSSAIVWALCTLFWQIGHIQISIYLLLKLLKYMESRSKRLKLVNCDPLNRKGFDLQVILRLYEDLGKYFLQQGLYSNAEYLLQHGLLLAEENSLDTFQIIFSLHIVYLNSLADCWDSNRDTEKRAIELYNKMSHRLCAFQKIMCFYLLGDANHYRQNLPEARQNYDLAIEIAENAKIEHFLFDNPSQTSLLLEMVSPLRLEKSDLLTLIIARKCLIDANIKKLDISQTPQYKLWKCDYILSWIKLTVKELLRKWRIPMGAKIEDSVLSAECGTIIPKAPKCRIQKKNLNEILPILKSGLELAHLYSFPETIKEYSQSFMLLSLIHSSFTETTSPEKISHYNYCFQMLSSRRNLKHFDLSQNPCPISCTLDDSREKYTQRFLEAIPPGYVVCSVSFDQENEDIYITRCESKKEPTTLKLPICRHSIWNGNEDWFTYKEAIKEFDLIMEESYKTTSSNMDSSSRVDKIKWWKKRQELDTRMKLLLERIEKEWLGGFRGALVPLHLLPTKTQQKMMEDIQKLFESSLCPTKRRTVSTSTFRVGEEILLNFFRLEKISEEDVEELIYYVLDLFQLKGHNVDYEIVDKLCENILQILQKGTTLREGNEGHLILLFDNKLKAFPWESLSCLRRCSVSRAFSFELLIEQFEQLYDENKSINVSSCYYILNPSEDLHHTQSTFEGLLKREPSWKGVIGRKPSETEILECFQSYDILLYFGHGSGEPFFKEVMRQGHGVCKVAILMGCSSCSLQMKGVFEPSGFAIDYSYSGSLAIVGNLWDVTDKDIDRFSLKLMDLWKEGKEGSRSYSLCQAVSAAREACTFKYLIGASPVVYGIPVYYNNSNMSPRSWAEE